MLSKSSFATDTIGGMERGNSVLLTFGEPGHDLKRKIALTGFICRVLLFLIFNPLFLLRARFFPNIWRRRKLSAIRLVRMLCPFSVKGHQVEPSAHGHIAVINHPTLNDPICAVLYILSLYPDRDVIVPINLPWFESVCRYRSKLLKLGVNIVPVLTPQTAKRLNSCENMSGVQSALMANYVAEFTDILSRGGLAVVAQQATRQRYLFADPAQTESGEDILPTVTLLLLGLRRAKLLEKALFVPVGVIPHNVNAKPKLNIFRKYELNVGSPIPAADLSAVKNAAKRPADLHMLRKLMELLPSEYHFESTKIS